MKRKQWGFFWSEENKFLFQKYLFLFYAYECLACMHVCVPGDYRGHKMALDPLELALTDGFKPSCKY